MKMSLSCLLLLAAVPGAASAADLTYSYVEGGYARANVDGLNGGGDGFGLDGSANMTTHIFIDAGLQGFSWDTHQPFIEKIYAERDFTHAGLHLPVSDDVDAIFRVGIIQVNVSSSNTNYASNLKDGYDVGLGLRAVLPARFELEAGIGADSAELVYSAPNGMFTANAFADDRAEKYATIALRYHVTEHFLLGASYTTRSGANPGFGETANMQNLYLAARWDFY